MEYNTIPTTMTHAIETHFAVSLSPLHKEKLNKFASRYHFTNGGGNVYDEADLQSKTNQQQQDDYEVYFLFFIFILFILFICFLIFEFCVLCIGVDVDVYCMCIVYVYVLCANDELIITT